MQRGRRRADTGGKILCKEQVQLAGMLAMGNSKKQACEQLGIALSTATRWVADEDFDALYMKLRTVHNEAFTAVLRTTAKEQAAMFKNQLKSYRQKRMTLAASQLDVAEQLLAKISDRVAEMPIDSLQPAQIGNLLTAISQMSSKAFDGWADVIGINQLNMQFQEMEDEIKSAQPEVEEEEADDTIEADAEPVEVADIDEGEVQVEAG